MHGAVFIGRRGRSRRSGQLGKSKNFPTLPGSSPIPPPFTALWLSGFAYILVFSFCIAPADLSRIMHTERTRKV